jgi:hypothetical protein
METASSTQSLIAELRGDRDHRPKVDRMLAGGLRAWLEDELADLAGVIDPTAPVILSPRTVFGGRMISVPPVIAIARGALVSALVSQRLIFGHIEHPMDDALSALEADPTQRDLVDAVHSLEPDAFAQLAAEVAAHDAVLARELGSVPSSWLPRSMVRLSASLAGGRFVLSGVADVMVGPPARDVASVCLLDVTTTTPDDLVNARLGVLALIETLRSSAPPLRVASLSTTTGETVIVDVTDTTLTTALCDVVDAAKRRGGTS